MKSLEHKTSLAFDLFFCLLIMPLMMVILGPARYWWELSPAFTCLAVSYLYACYFTVRALRLPALILSGFYGRVALIAAVFALLTYLLTIYPLPEVDFVIPSMSEYQTRVRNYNVAITLWLMFFIVIGYSLTVAFIKELYHRTLLQHMVESQRDKAQLALYKAQINPHFLFNTLNSLYGLVISGSEKAEDAFIKFTELLRYTYVTADSDWVTISDEINYINDYIDLQLIRLDSHTKVVRECEVDDGSAVIPPMVFLTFVENAFKYGASSSRDCEILVRMTLRGGHLRFETRNRIVRHPDEFRKDMPVGIANCRNRLSALFPGAYTLDIQERNETFHVLLNIDISCIGNINKDRNE